MIPIMSNHFKRYKIVQNSKKSTVSRSYHWTTKMFWKTRYQSFNTGEPKKSDGNLLIQVKLFIYTKNLKDGIIAIKISVQYYKSENLKN